MRCLVVLCALLAMVAANSHHKHCDIHLGCAVMWDEKDCGGKHVQLDDGRMVGSLRGVNFNDKATSVRVHTGCRLEMWDNSDFRGDSMSYNHGYHHIDARFNNRASSAVCRC